MGHEIEPLFSLSTCQWRSYYDTMLTSPTKKEFTISYVGGAWGIVVDWSIVFHRLLYLRAVWMWIWCRQLICQSPFFQNILKAPIRCYSLFFSKVRRHSPSFLQTLHSLPPTRPRKASSEAKWKFLNVRRRMSWISFKKTSCMWNERCESLLNFFKNGRGSSWIGVLL